MLSSNSNHLQRNIEAIVIGVSAGGVEALNQLFPQLPGNFQIPILVALHLAPDYAFVPEAFQAPAGLQIKEAEDKEPIKAGYIYFAPPNYHLLVEKERVLSLSTEEPIHFARPAIDALFESAAEVFGPQLIGIILTGANEDGAAGLKCIHHHGGTTVVQNPSEARMKRMPEAAIEQCQPHFILTLKEIALFLAGLAPQEFAKSML